MEGIWQEKENIAPFHWGVAIYSMDKTEEGGYMKLVIILPHSPFLCYKLLCFGFVFKMRIFFFFLLQELKNLLFGSSLCCFSEEWKIQSFTFTNIPQLKYGIVQKKVL